MKIEKLTDNKIRIILNIEDLEKNNVDFKSILSHSAESQNLLLNILTQAEKEVGFYTKDSKILIEAFGSSNGQLIFTITKFSPGTVQTLSPKKKLNAKRKNLSLTNKNAIYSFDSFDVFCDFCSSLSDSFHKDIKHLCSNVSLYFYNDTYYLIFRNINPDFKLLKSFYSSISEFAHFTCASDIFERKLVEHGKVIFKSNALKKCAEIFG
ncbi:MAG: adaptor protein MecA [Clostridia bacterium]|nr:adaptor protein MecA [Clostridia bacterium]